jgi:branched-chain amino acid transport system ATP-binding protein
MMLSAQNLVASYGAVPVLENVSFSLARGEVLALLGRNGVGKTTLMRSLMGLIPSRRGKIELDGLEIGRAPAHAIARLGMALVPQGRGILGKLTVEENIAAGLRACGPRPPLSVAEAIAPFPVLKERLGDRAGSLSGGQQQQLALARAIVCRPKVLLLDEPSEGVQPNIVAEIGRLIRHLTQHTGLAVLLVEQNIELALATAQRCLVMEKGRIVHQGPAEELRDDAILKRYLAL